MNEQIYIAIDGGINGSLIAISGKKILFKEKMPIVKTKESRSEYNSAAIIEILQKYPDATVILEKAHPMPKLGTIQAFSFGKSFGMMIGILEALKRRYHIIHAKTWQKEIFRDLGVDNTKTASVMMAKRLFPEEDFKATPRCKKDHDGFTDATLIAVYAQRKQL